MNQYDNVMDETLPSVPKFSLRDIFSKGLEVLGHPTQKEEKPSKQEVTWRVDPDVENGYIIQYGENPDQIFYAEADKEKDIKKLAKIIGHAIEDKETAASFDSIPPEKRPVLSVHHDGDYGGICCPGEPGEIGIRSTVGDGYKAASIFVHEFHHHKQHQDSTDYAYANYSVADKMLEMRLCEAAATTAEVGYLYRMKDKAPMTYAWSYVEGGALPAYAKTMKKTNGDRDQSAIAAIRGYSSDMGTAKFYENWYFKDVIRSTKKLASSLNTYIERGSDAKKKEAAEKGDYVSNFYVSRDHFDLEAILKHHACDLFSEKGQKDALEAVQKPDVNYVTGGVCTALLENQSFVEKAGLIKGDELDKLAVRTSLGTFSYGDIKKSKGPMRALIKAQNKVMSSIVSLNSFLVNPLETAKEGFQSSKQNLQNKLKKIQESISPSKQTIYNSFSYNKGELFANFSDTPYKTTGNEVMHMNIDVPRDDPKYNAYMDKAQKMFSILMADPAVKADILDKDVDFKPLLKFDEKVDKGSTVKGHEISLNPKMTEFEMAAQFVKQMHKIKQYKEGGEILQGHGTAEDYRIETNMMRSPDQLIAEKRLCEAAADTAMAEFMHKNKDMMSPSDKLKSMTNTAYTTFEKNFKESDGSRVAAISFTMEALAEKQKKDMLPEDYFHQVSQNIVRSFETGASMNPHIDSMGQAEATTKMFSKRVDEAQIAQVACAGLLKPEEQKYLANVVKKNPELRKMSEKTVSDVKKMTNLRAASRQFVEAKNAALMGNNGRS